MEQLFIFSFKYNRAVTLVVIDHTFLEELEPEKRRSVASIYVTISFSLGLCSYSKHDF